MSTILAFVFNPVLDFIWQVLTCGGDSDDQQSENTSSSD